MRGIIAIGIAAVLCLNPTAAQEADQKSPKPKDDRAALAGVADGLPKQDFARCHSFDLPAFVDQEQRSQLREIRLYVKSPLGEWKLYESIAPYQSMFRCKVAEDGEYWFLMAIVDKQGVMTPAELKTRTPDRRVIVDTTAPVIQVRSWRSPNGVLCLRCTVSDTNPDTASLKAVCKAPSGSISLEPVKNKTGAFYLKGIECIKYPVVVTATDLAGNVGVKEVSVVELLGGVTPKAPQGLPPGPVNLPPPPGYVKDVKAPQTPRPMPSAEGVEPSRARPMPPAEENAVASTKASRTTGGVILADWKSPSVSPLGAWRLGGTPPPISRVNLAPESPQTASGYFSRGNQRWGAGQFEQAIGDYTQAILLDPTDADLYRVRGNAWAYRREYEKAGADYTTAIHLAPRDTRAYVGRAGVHVRLGKADAALADLDAAIRVDPKDANLYKTRGNAWSHRQEFGKAIADYASAIRLAPEDLKAYGTRGLLLMHVRRYDEAIADFDAVIRLDPKDADGHAARGLALIAKRDYQSAMAAFAEAVHLKPGYVEVYLFRGRLWHAEGELRKAIADYDVALRLKANQSDVYYLRGKAYGELGDYRKAAADFTRFIDSHPREASGYGMRALAHFALGDAPRGWADLAKASKLGDAQEEASLPATLASRERERPE